jgi:hypothetical protein
MASDLFRSSWEKLDRADRHFQELAAKIQLFVEQMEAEGRLMYEFEVQYRPRSHCLVYSLSGIQPTEMEWGVILGDVLHNLRSALDHIAWSLVTAGRQPPSTLNSKERNAVKFPIYKTKGGFNDAVKPPHPNRSSCIPGVSRQEIAFIRGLQPYKGGKRADWHPFAILQQFSNADKHHAVQLAFHRPYDPEFVFDTPRDFLPARHTSPKVIIPEVGAEVLRIYGRRTGPNPYVPVKIGSSAEVAIEGRFWVADTYTSTKSLIHLALYHLASMKR